MERKAEDMGRGKEVGERICGLVARGRRSMRLCIGASSMALLRLPRGGIWYGPAALPSAAPTAIFALRPATVWAMRTAC
jgi:hypothetical protein